MPDTGRLLPPCRWWDAATLGLSRDVYHVTAEGAANRLTGIVSLLVKATAPVAFVLFLRERRRNSTVPQAEGGGTPPPA